MNKLEEAAKNIHARARKFTKRQIAAMTAVIMGLAAATIVSFSQEAQQETQKKEEEIPPLPKTITGKLALHNKAGKEIVVRLISRTKDTLTFQKVNSSGSSPETEEKIFTQPSHRLSVKSHKP